MTRPVGQPLNAVSGVDVSGTEPGTREWRNTAGPDSYADAAVLATGVSASATSYGALLAEALLKVPGVTQAVYDGKAGVVRAVGEGETLVSGPLPAKVLDNPILLFENAAGEVVLQIKWEKDSSGFYHVTEANWVGGGRILNFRYENGRLVATAETGATGKVQKHFGAGGELLYSGSWDAEGKQKILFYDAAGAAYDPEAKWRELGDAAFVAFMQGQLDTEEKYVPFEAIFMREDSTSPVATTPYPEEVRLALRGHGKALLGVAALEEAIEEEFGVAVETEKRPPSLNSRTHDRIPVAELMAMLVALEKGMNFYPDEFLRESGLKSVSLFTHLRDPGIGPLNGYAVDGFLVYNGHPDTFDHELFHCLDFADGIDEDDASWGLAVYGADYELARVRTGEVLPPAGYASAYAFVGGELRLLAGGGEYSVVSQTAEFAEDQAETAERLLHDYRGLIERARGDAALAEKIRRIKTVYYARSGGLMDEEFWNDLAAGIPIDGDYWTYRSGNPAMIGAEGRDAIAAASLAERAWTAHESLDAAAEAALYARLNALDPGDPVSLAREGLARFRTGEEGIGQDLLERAVQAGSRDPAVFACLSERYVSQASYWDMFKTGGTDFAVAQYRALMEAADFDNPAAYAEMAQLYLLSDRPEMAADVYRQKILAAGECSESGADNSPYLYYFAKFLEWGRNSMDAALYRSCVDFIVAYLDVTRRDAVFYGTVDRLAALGEIDAAKAVLDAALESDEVDAYLFDKRASFDAPNLFFNIVP